MLTPSLHILAAPVEAATALAPSVAQAIELLGVIGVAIVVLAVADRAATSLRAELKRRHEARRAPGSTPLHPLVVQSFDEIFELSHTRCSCDNEPKVVFEGPTSSNKRKLWLVIQICPRCDRRFQTYYDVTNASDTPPLASPPITPAPR